MPAEAVLNVTIPVFNHAELVQRTLAALRKTSQEIPFCITVVDNGSDERLVARLREFRPGSSTISFFCRATWARPAPPISAGNW